jgi:hypothetical protein
MQVNELKNFSVRVAKNGYIVDVTYSNQNPDVSYTYETHVFEDYGAFLDYLDHIFLGIGDHDEVENE